MLLAVVAPSNEGQLLHANLLPNPVAKAIGTILNKRDELKMANERAIADASESSKGSAHSYTLSMHCMKCLL